MASAPRAGGDAMTDAPYFGVLSLAVLIALVIVLRWVAWRFVGLTRRVWRQSPDRLRRWGVHDRAAALGRPLARRYPRISEWVAGRFEATHFMGLPLTLMIAAALYMAVLFGGLVEEVLEAEEIERIDRAIVAAFDPWRGPVGIDVMSWITNLGDSATLAGVLVVATGFLWASRRTLYILPQWLAFAGSWIVTWAGKFILARPRPEFLTGVMESSPAFPSGHATSSLAVYGFVAYAIARDLPSDRARFEVIYWACMLILLIGISRVYLSVHFASDVAAGFLVGGFWLLTAICAAEWRRSIPVTPPPSNG